MSQPLQFTLKPLSTKPKLNASLAERSRGTAALMESRALTPAPTLTVHADFNGDGVRDSFELQIQEGPQVTLQCQPNRCTLFALENTMDTFQPMLNRDSYRLYLNTLHAIFKLKNSWWNALSYSIDHTMGVSHTWVVPEPRPRYPWMDGTPLHTDCVIDVERTLAELHAPTSRFSDFQRLFNRIQFYNYNGHKERTDFFTTEAVPHLVALGYLSDSTDAYHGQIHTGTTSAPTFTATINKENWYKGRHNGQASGRNFPEQRVDLSYIPFADVLTVSADGTLQLAPALARSLPPVSIMVIMNKGRVFKALGTEIPDSHVAYLIKDSKTGEVYVHHSTPTTDLNLAAVTTEDFSRFMQLRYCKADNGNVVTTDKTAVGIKILTLIPRKK